MATQGLMVEGREEHASRLPMKLVKVKIRGLAPIPVTEWFETNHNLNLLHAPEPTRRNGIITALETLNPPYDCRDVRPFRDLPRLIRKDGHQRTIHPHKRTIVMGVYDSTAKLVAALADISPLLYETDLIEVGRRLDYSRWVNFIELASSTRWSEIAAHVHHLRGRSTPANEEEQRLFSQLDTLEATDRITGTLMRELASWLERYRTATPAPARESITELMTLVRRADSFAQARQLITRQLPWCVVLPLGRPVAPSTPTITTDAATSSATLDRLITLTQERLGEQSESDREHVLSTLNRQWLEDDRPYRFTASWQDSRLSLSLLGRDGSAVPPRWLSPPEHLQFSGSLARTLAVIIWGTEPIALVPLPEPQDAGIPVQDVAGTIKELARRMQCFCIGDMDHYFPGKPRLAV